MTQVNAPPPRYLGAEHVIGAMGEFGRHRLETLGAGRTLLLGAVGGAFITAGALLSVVLGAGVEPAGMQLLVMGLAFSSGFFFVVLSEAVLFTEANVVLPATLLGSASSAGRVARFWVLGLTGNLLGALLVGGLVTASQTYPPEVTALLSDAIDSKMHHHAEGTPWAWLQLVLSGMLANWLVGMAAFFAFMGRTIIGKYIPVALAVTLFVAAGFQHSPANMGFFSLSIQSGGGPGWGAAIWWNLVPAGLGNMLGGTLLVAVPFWYAFKGGQATVPADAEGSDPEG